MTEKLWDTYPDDYDILWIAADEADKVAVFLSAGRGPIPRALLEDYDLLEIDNGFMDQPSVSRGISTSATEFSDHIQTLSSKGAYFYDWSDVHRTTASCAHMRDWQRHQTRLSSTNCRICLRKRPAWCVLRTCTFRRLSHSGRKTYLNVHVRQDHSCVGNEWF